MGGLLATAIEAAPVPGLTSDLPVERGVHQSSDGVVDLRWEGADGATFELQQRTPRHDFETRYRGQDQASIRSGLLSGVHDFRVREIDSAGVAGPWSGILTVAVVYIEGGRLKLLLVLGGLVVLATIGAIVHGHFSHHRREGAR